jgi:hypothetical protein
LARDWKKAAILYIDRIDAGSIYVRIIASWDKSAYYQVSHKAENNRYSCIQARSACKLDEPLLNFPVLHDDPFAMEHKE